VQGGVTPDSTDGVAGSRGAGGILGTSRAGGSTGTSAQGGSGACSGIFCANFDQDTTNVIAPGWTRAGGAATDWVVVKDGSGVLQQKVSTDDDFRLVFANGSGGASWGGATSAKARIKILSSVSQGTVGTSLCVRNSGGDNGDFACLTLIPKQGVQVQSRVSGSVSNGPIWNVEVSVATWYSVQLSVDANGSYRAVFDGATLGSFTPSKSVASGFVALATRGAKAEFDDIVVTQP
jgi:hypothetical protein